ncbi:MAG: sugar phosphate nucleotidyltransferase, partial [Gemmatimonadaceae bacterium]
RRYYSALTLTRIRITTAVQERALGTADAVLAAESFAAGQTLLVLNADNYYPVDAYRALRTLGAAGLVAFDRGALVAGGAIPAERIAEYALVQTDEHGMLRRIVEKPDAATLQRWTAPALVSMNLWALPSEIYAACRAIGPSARGERELPGAVQYCIDRYCVEFRAVPMRGAVLDLSSRRDVAEVAARLAGVRPVL